MDKRTFRTLLILTVCCLVIGSTAAAADPVMTDLGAWYKADALAYNDGDQVVTWPDSSGNEVDLTMVWGIGGKFKPNYLNGLPVVRCVQDAIWWTTGNILPASNEYTIFTVTANWNVGTPLCVRRASLDNQVIHGLYGTPEIQHFITTTDYSDRLHQKTVPMGGGIFESKWGSTSSDMMNYVDGVASTLSVTGTASDLDNIARMIVLGEAQGFPASLMTGDIAEVLVYTRKLSEVESEQTGIYLEEKWGLNTAYGGVQQIVATPTFNRDAGNYAVPIYVTIACDTPGATIRYTTNGDDPDSGSDEYTVPVLVDHTLTLKAKAWKEDYIASNVKSAEYTITGTLLGAWFKADALGLNDGDGVVTWPDSSGNGKDATAVWGPLEGARFTTNVINGLPVARFLGDRIMWTPALEATDEYTVFTVTANWTAGPFIILRKAPLVENFIHGWLGLPAARMFYSTTAGFVVRDHQDDVPDTGGIFETVWGPTTPDIRSYVDGVASTLPITGANPAFNPVPREITIGDSQGFYAGQMYGDVAEIRVYLRKLTWDERQQVGNELALKYGLTTDYGRVPDPEFNPGADAYDGAISVEITCEAPGATIRYTTDGSDPTTNSAEYNGSVTVSQSLTLKAKAWKDGYIESSVASADYVIVYPTSIANIKAQADGNSVGCGNAVVTAIFGDTFYVETEDRSNGIRVDLPGHSVAVGQKPLISGTVQTDPVTAERYIQAALASNKGTGSVAPVVLNNRALGGGPAGLQQGVTGATGPNNIGLLVKAYGKVLQPGVDEFSIDDGSGVSVKVILPAGSGVPAAGVFVTVTGISSCEKDGSIINRLIRATGSVQVPLGPDSTGIAFSTFGGGKQIWIRGSNFVGRSEAGGSPNFVSDPGSGSKALTGSAYHFYRSTASAPAEQLDWWVQYEIPAADAPFDLNGFWAFWARTSQSVSSAAESDWVIVNGDFDDLNVSNPTDADWLAGLHMDNATERILDGIMYAGLVGYNFGWFSEAPGGPRWKQMGVIDGKVAFRIYEREAGPTNALIDLICWSDDDLYVPTDTDLLSLAGW
ncbi:MAG: chitobiase/beta-hexosaminidase C-terminal domain-containing protein [Armatimonadetes bacterium]|nr:chitobiase/beta-hexosaminidase C-terminal domain-containing protein [Armatimonadota bacterium]